MKTEKENELKLQSEDITFIKTQENGNVLAFDKNNNIYISNDNLREAYETILTNMSVTIENVSMQIEQLLGDDVTVKVIYHIRPKQD